MQTSHSTETMWLHWYLLCRSEQVPDWKSMTNFSWTTMFMSLCGTVCVYFPVIGVIVCVNDAVPLWKLWLPSASTDGLTLNIALLSGSFLSCITSLYKANECGGFDRKEFIWIKQLHILQLSPVLHCRLWLWDGYKIICIYKVLGGLSVMDWWAVPRVSPPLAQWQLGQAPAPIPLFLVTRWRHVLHNDALPSYSIW